MSKVYLDFEIGFDSEVEKELKLRNLDLESVEDCGNYCEVIIVGNIEDIMKYVEDFEYEVSVIEES